LAEKEEEKKLTGFDELERHHLIEKAKQIKKELIEDGYSEDDAHKLAIIRVKRDEIQIPLRRDLAKDATYYLKRARQGDTEARIEYRKIAPQLYKLADEIRNLNKEEEKITKKKELYHGTSFSQIEAKRREAIEKIEREMAKLPKRIRDEEIKKKHEEFDEILKIRGEKQKEEGLSKETYFKCPEPGCGKRLYESFDEHGHVVLKCKEHGTFHPRELYDKKMEESYGHTTAGGPAIPYWKVEEADKMAESYGNEKKRLRKLLSEGKISRDEYKKSKKDAKKDVYGDKKKHKEEMERIDAEIAALDPTAADYESKKQALEEQKKEIDHKYKPKGIRGVRSGRALARFANTGEDFIKKVIFIVALIGIGAVIAASLGNMWFFFGFLSVGLFFLTPPPNEIEHEGGPLSWGHMIPFAGKGGAHSGFAWIRSITKVAAIICFAYGFKSMGDIFNTFFIITCLGGYFALKLTYSPDRPGDFIESLLRFGILGCYFIPFIVFAGIFNSYVLAAIAFAFFAIPPMPETSKGQNLGEILSRGLSGQTAYYEMFDKLLFLGLMFFALLGSGVLGDLPLFGTLGWALTGTLKYTFIYFWVVALIGGFFSPARERPLTGILFLGGATIIYGIGPGSQDIGSALLGQWWPTVNQAVTTISEPISKMFSQLGKTFGDAFLLLTNPVGYATQLMNGSYSNNPVGETGAYGLELSGFDVSPVFIEQPFMITTNIKNSGAYNAEGVAIALSVGGKAPESTTSTGLPGLNTVPNPELKVGNNTVTISGIGITTDCATKTAWADTVDKTYICVQNYATSQGIDDLKAPFTRQNIWQAVFSSSGISCSNSAIYQLRKKSIPINVTLSYKYQSDSKVPIEFISQAEWDRLAKLDQLNSRLQIIKSEYSSAPVQFPIGTPGLKNPILETQDFHIALNLMSNQQGGKISGIDSIVLNYPTDFILADDKCSPDPKNGGGSYSDGKVEWKGLKTGDQIFFCHFKALKQGSTSKLGTSPTKTYVIIAHANYTYANSQQKLVKVEFGSWCCADNIANSKDECASGKCCSEQYPGQSKGKGICAPSTQNC
jgi:hypothetical protein